ncbi:porin family protein [Prevotella sp. 10(H)]|uniref:porin family protein n=1 Tax=Prevotella sp. 10(H) TaxID=1158294 RepID=UPI0004A72A7C|nr:porin family protein [Prevotella sp. 10(H)]
MKTIRKAFLIISLIIAGSQLYAQDLTFSITAHAGVGISEIDAQDLKTDPLFSYRGGVGVEFNLPKKFFIQTGLDFATKGTKSDIAISDVTGMIIAKKTKTKMSYLILPLRGGYRLSVSDDVRMNLSFGTYFGLGVGGKINTIDVDTFSDNTYKRFDMGLSGNVGVEYRRCLLNIGYDFGLIDYSRTEFSSYNNNLYLTIGYRII